MFNVRRSTFTLLVLLASRLLANEPHTFTFDSDPSAKSVAVAGDFNGWSTSANPMQYAASGKWTATLTLPEGIHFYKFVINGDKWTPDPKYSDKELEKDDNYGGHNSAILVGLDTRKYPSPTPNHIETRAVLHNPSDSQDLNVASDHLLRVRVRAQAHDIDSATLLVHDGASTIEQPMQPLSTVMGLTSYATVVETHADKVEYLIRLKDQSTTVDVGAALSSDFVPVSMHPAFSTPDWAKNAVWYQIFPERFRNGDSSNDPPNTKPWTSDWFSTLPGEASGEENFYKGKGNVWFRRYGGDVQGLKQSLPYLKSLGITAIYLNPMFEAESMHKYDATDYRHIDEFFGVKGDYPALLASGVETDDPKTWTWTPSDKLFLDFVAEAHKQGFKVILDGVFNHVGRAHWAFQDVLKNGKSSKYADWFDVRDWNQPIKYIAWDTGGDATDHGSLPVFKKDPELGLVHGPREHVLAIAKRWIAPDGDPSRGVDGWRLDVPGDVPHPFWVDFRKTVKAANPDAYITGEIWDFAQPWLHGDQFDAVMNYRFADVCQQFFVNQKKAITPSEFASKCSEIVNAYPLQVSLDQMNLFDSHDTDRFASMFVNPDLAYDATNRIQDNGPNYSPAKPNDIQWARMKQAVVFQMTFLGAPMIYYGDEAGMWSPDDPSNRQPMLWKDLQPYANPQVTFKQDLFDHYHHLIEIRQSLKPLRLGYFQPLITNDKAGTVVFARTLGDQTVYVALNRSAQPHTITIPTQSTLTNYLDAHPHPLSRPTVNLPPYGSAILSSQQP